MSTGSTIDYVVLHGFLEGLVSVELSSLVLRSLDAPITRCLKSFVVRPCMSSFLPSRRLNQL